MPNHSSPEFALAANGGFVQLAPLPIIAKRDPQVNDFAQLGQVWVNQVSNTVFILVGNTGGVASWVSSSQLLTSLTLNPGNLVVTAGNITATAGNLSIGGTSLLAGTVTINPGNLVVTAGNITASAGNLSIAGTSLFTGVVTVNNNVIVTPLAGVNGLSVTTLTTGIPATFASSAANIAALVLTTGGIRVTPVSNVAGASPQVINARFGQAIFTDVIANGAYGTLTITNSTAALTSVILANASCTTVNSALQIVEITPAGGSFAVRIFNAGAASTAADILVNFWVMS